MRECGLALGLILVATVGQSAPPGAQPVAAPNPKEVRIGFPEALFKDVPRTLINAAATPFQKMIQKEIGLHGTLNIVPDYAAVAEDMKNGKLDIAVFHGFEYAWVKNQPGLVPIVITNPSCGKVQACLVVHSDSKAVGANCLKGACIAVPKGSKAHCQMFLQRLCEKEKVKPGDCCPVKVAKAPTMTPEEALEAVIEGKCEAALVDISSLQAIQADKPGLSQQLKVLAKSELLPPAVVVCRRGALTEEQMKKVGEGLLNCNKTAIGRTFTMFWQLDGFKPVSPAYMDLLEKSLKDYPPPTAARALAPMPAGPKD